MSDWNGACAAVGSMAAHVADPIGPVTPLADLDDLSELTRSRVRDDDVRDLPALAARVEAAAQEFLASAASRDGVRASYDLHVRGGGRAVFVVADGGLRIEEPPTGRSTVTCRPTPGPSCCSYGRAPGWRGPCSSSGCSRGVAVRGWRSACPTC